MKLKYNFFTPVLFKTFLVADKKYLGVDGAYKTKLVTFLDSKVFNTSTKFFILYQ